MAAPVKGTAVTQGDTGTSSDTTFNFTAAAGETYLVVGVAIRGASMSSLNGISFGAQALSVIKDQLDNSGNHRLSVWGGTITPGTQTITVDYNGGNANAVVAARAYTGVISVGTGVATVMAAGTTTQVTLNCGGASLGIDFVSTAAGDNNPTIDASQTVGFTRAGDGAAQVEIDGSEKVAAVTMDWSGLNHNNDDSIQIGVELVGTPDPIAGDGAYTEADDTIAGEGTRTIPAGGPGQGDAITRLRYHRFHFGG